MALDGDLDVVGGRIRLLMVGDTFCIWVSEDDA